MEEPPGGQPPPPEATSYWGAPPDPRQPGSQFGPPPSSWAPPGPGPEQRPAMSPAGYPLYVTYSIGMALVYVAAAIFGYYLTNNPLDSVRYTPEEVRFQGIVLLAVGAPLAVFFLFGAFVPKRPWGWVYGLVLVCLGVTSCCTWPLTIPILLKWFKPDMKRYFRMG